jgi:hypothetical protein
MMETMAAAKTNNCWYSKNHIKVLSKASNIRLLCKRYLQKLMLTRTQNLIYARIP